MSEMKGFVKKKYRVPFFQLEHHVLEDSRINGNAYRLITHLLTKPDDWEFYVSNLQKRMGVGRSAFETARNQLYKYGYLEYKTHRRGTDFYPFERPDENPTYMDKKEGNGKRIYELSDWLRDIREKEKKSASAGEPKQKAEKQTSKSKASNNNVSSSKKKSKKSYKNFKSTSNSEFADEDLSID